MKTTTTNHPVSLLAFEDFVIRINHEAVQYKLQKEDEQKKAFDDDHNYEVYLYAYDERPILINYQSKKNAIKKLKGLNSIVASSIIALEKYDG